MERALHIITYFNNPRDRSRDPHEHQRRDLGAALELAPAFLAEGYMPGEQLLQQPCNDDDGDDDPEVRRAKRPPSAPLPPFLGRHDLLLQVTRPALSDPDHKDQKQIRPCDNALERRLRRIWGRYFSICARSHVMLARGYQRRLPRGKRSRADIQFLQRKFAPYKEMSALDHTGRRRIPKEARDRSAVYLLRLDEVWRNGPGLVGIFGMDGMMTQIWAYRLARDLRHLLQRPGFLMGELLYGERPEKPTDFRWSMDWTFEEVMHVPPREPMSRFAA